jgi:hypothetical protein
MIRLAIHNLWITGAADDPEDQCAHGTVDFSVERGITRVQRRLSLTNAWSGL